VKKSQTRITKLVSQWRGRCDRHVPPPTFRPAVDIRGLFRRFGL